MASTSNKPRKSIQCPKEDSFICLAYALEDETESNDCIFSVWQDFYHHQTFSVDQSHTIRKFYIPNDCIIKESFRSHIFIQLRSDWTLGDKIYKKDSILALSLSHFYVTDDQKKDVTLIFDPQPHLSFDGLVTTKNEVLLQQLNHVKPEIFWFTRIHQSWTSLQRVPFDIHIGNLSIVSSRKDTTALLNVESFIHPLTFYLWDEERHRFKLLRQTEFFPSQGYHMEQRFATSTDGTQISYFLVYKKGIHFDGKNPTILDAYGGFQNSQLPFYPRNLANIWLKNGGIYVLANIRGGGEYGVRWHDEARKDKRHKAFEDFLSVAQALIYDQVTSPQHLGIWGESNGGLLVTVAMTQRPDLFRAVISDVPILDMERYHEFGAGPSWIEEYGDPSDPQMLAYLSSYSPLNNIFKDRVYPTLLLTSSPQDQRVHPWHVRILKWMMDQHPNAKSYFIEKEDAGHGSGADLNDIIETVSRRYTFFAKTLGLSIR